MEAELLVLLPRWQRWVLTVFNPFLVLGRLGIKGYLRVFQDIRVSETAKCPACGARQKHKIHYAEAYEVVIHQCSICQAAWGSKTVVPTTRWKIVRVDSEKTQAPKSPPT